jgi:hypothetical protein
VRRSYFCSTVNRFGTQIDAVNSYPCRSYGGLAMEEYEQLVERCRKHRVNELITNASINHAGVLFENLFKAARSIPSSEEKAMMIQCGNALPEFYAQFEQVAKEVMDSGVALRVLLCDHSHGASTNSFLKMVAKHPKGAVRVRGAECDDSIHFVVVGTSAYRVETDLDSVQAFANFNEPVVASHLIKMFERHWAVATPLFVDSVVSGDVAFA